MSTPGLMVVLQSIAALLLGDEDYLALATDPDRRDAVALVDAFFEDDTKTSAWSSWDKATLCGRLAELVAKPHLIDQRPTGYCGPAGILYVLAKRYPKRFARFALGIIGSGTGEFGSLTIEMSSSFRSFDLATHIANKYEGIAPTDYVLMLTVQEALSTFGIDSPTDYSATPNVLFGPIESFFDDTGLFEVDDLGDDYASIAAADREGADIVLEGSISLFSSAMTPDHVVVMEPPLKKLDSGQIEFHFWSWGMFQGTQTPTVTSDKRRYKMTISETNFDAKLDSALLVRANGEDL